MDFPRCLCLSLCLWTTAALQLQATPFSTIPSTPALQAAPRPLACRHRRIISSGSDIEGVGEKAQAKDNAGRETPPALPTKPQQRQTSEEAWEKAPEGSFLSPALAAGLIVLGMALRQVLIGD